MIRELKVENMIRRFLNTIERKRREKSLLNYPYRFRDSKGRLWFNPEYRVSFYKLRKIM